MRNQKQGMKVATPQFRQGYEWRKLSKAERKGKPWKYILLKDMFLEVETGVTRHYDCTGADGHVWAMILPHGIWLSKGYAWNGNTGSPDKLLGVWLLLGAVFHDLLFQFSGCSQFPAEITLGWSNRLYFALSPRWIGWAYYAGLTVGSWALWGKPPKDGEYVTSYPLYFPEPI
jgi:hypothetical protein